MRAARAEFVTSVPPGGRLPGRGLPCLALVGRSNVGKSSLINALVRQRIARAGAKPGTTRLLNLYRVTTAAPRARSFWLVDLPGYGYARGGDHSRREFKTLTDGFFARAGDALRGLIVLVDIRHPGLDADVAAHAWASGLGLPVVAVATKCDRVSRAEARRALRLHEEALGRTVIPVSTKGRPGANADTASLAPVWAAVAALLEGPAILERSGDG